MSSLRMAVYATLKEIQRSREMAYEHPGKIFQQTRMPKQTFDTPFMKSIQQCHESNEYLVKVKEN